MEGPVWDYGYLRISLKVSYPSKNNNRDNLMLIIPLAHDGRVGFTSDGKLIFPIFNYISSQFVIKGLGRGSSFYFDIPVYHKPLGIGNFYDI